MGALGLIGEGCLFCQLLCPATVPVQGTGFQRASVLSIKSRQTHELCFPTEKPAGLIIILASTGLTSVDDLKQLVVIGVFASNTFGEGLIRRAMITG